MTFPLRASLAAAALAALALAPASAAEAGAKKPKPRCTTAGKTLEATKDVRIYTRGKSTDDPTYACAYKSGRRFEIAGGECESGSFSGVQFAGRYLAVRVNFCGIDSEGSQVEVWNVARRKVVRRGQSDDGIGGSAGIASFVLAANGSLAYITTAASGTKKEVRTVTLGAERDAPATTVDSGAEIVDESLALDSGNTAYWRNGTTVKTAPLGAP
ncbi:MAG TPA: hypothetical protein VF231_08490 [Candidatus Limnocylindrales bacterium]